MTDHEDESGFELVVDRRVYIIAFAVVILVCGCFFVWGYMAGKRQGMQLTAITDTDTSTGPGIEGSMRPAADADESIEEVQTLQEDAVQQDLDWYQSVNRKSSDPEGVRPPRPSVAKEATGNTPAVSNKNSDTVTYSVQVGAFKRLPEAEAHARNVRSRGFDSRVEPPESSGQLYLVKVGKFNTRAEAVAVQLRLKNSGFSCFVKTN